MRDRYKTLFDHADSGILLLDMDGRVLEHNTAAARLLGFEQASLVRRPFGDFVTPYPSANFADKLRLLRDLRKLNLEATRRRAQITHQASTGPELIIDATLVPWSGGHAALIFLREFSRREGMEQELAFLRKIWGSMSAPRFQHGFLVDGAGAVLALQLWDDPNKSQQWVPEEQEAAAREAWMAGLLQSYSLQDALARAWAGQSITLQPAWYTLPDHIAMAGSIPPALLQKSWCLRVEMRPWMGTSGTPDAVLVLTGDATPDWYIREEDRRKRRQTFVDLYSHTLSTEFHRHLDMIQAQATKLKKSAAPGEPEHQSATVLMDACANLTSLLRLNRNESSIARNVHPPLDLNAMVMETIAELRGAAASNVTIQFEQGSGLPNINADAALLKELLLTLGRLARANMPVGGELRISTFPLFADSVTDQGANGAGLSWSDSGVGLVRPNRAQSSDWLSEPGLRLDPQADCAYLFSLMRRMGTQHELDAAPGRKTTWRVFFQTSEASAQSSGKAENALDSSLGYKTPLPKKVTTSLVPARQQNPVVPTAPQPARTSSGQIAPPPSSVAIPPRKFSSSPVLETISGITYATEPLPGMPLSIQVSPELAARPTPPVPAVSPAAPVQLPPPAPAPAAKLSTHPKTPEPAPPPAPEPELPPAPTAQLKPPSSAVSPSVPKKPGALQILVADDEENVRDFTSKLLGIHGHEVEAAADGQEVLDLFMKNPQRWELVVLDAYMPRLGGLEAYLRMQMVKPELPVIFVSGYVRGASRKALLSACPGRVQMLQKPFTPEELQKAVEDSMNPKAAPVIDEQDI